MQKKFLKPLLLQQKNSAEVININVFDFDNTLYRGESTLDFYFFCVKNHPLLIKFALVVLYNLIKYKMCLISEDKLSRLADKYICAFLKGCPDIEKLAEKFWDKNINNIKKSVYSRAFDGDLVISASFGFLLRPLFSRLDKKVKLLCSEADLKEYKILQLCFRKNKIVLFKKHYPNVIVNDFYTDSPNDLEFMKLAENKAYMVKGDNICEYDFS